MENLRRAKRLAQTFQQIQRIAGLLEQKVSKAYSEFDLTSSQFNTLRLLTENSKLAQRDIADLLLKTGGNVTLVVDHLSQRGLVERNRDTSDRRVIYVSLTEQGRALYQKAVPVYEAAVVAAMSSVNEAEVASLAAILQEFETQAPSLSA